MVGKILWRGGLLPAQAAVADEAKPVPSGVPEKTAFAITGQLPAPLTRDVFMSSQSLGGIRFGSGRNLPPRDADDPDDDYNPPPPPPRPKITYEGFLRNSFTNNAGQKIPGREIVREFVTRRRKLDNEIGPMDYAYGKANPGRYYDSRYFWVLDTRFGFTSEETLRVVVNSLLESEILKDLNKGRPNAPRDIVLNEDIIVKFKKEFLSPEAEDKLKQMMPPKGSNDMDASKKKEYVNALLDLPWGMQTEDTHDVEAARKLFDDRFYGLEQLKTRILQKIAVRQLKGGNRGAIFMLVGPGGTGKTAIAKTIADALGRNYVRVSLAGVTDSNKINGHSYTYVGSKPGMIIDAMRQAGSMNPVVQLDEIDKTGSTGAHGDPKEALLAVLDPDQNKHFKDSYLDVPFDLSKTIFICTANSLDKFPEHFLSRVEIIEFPAYLEEEKMVIAKKHVIPEKMKDLNIPDNKVVIEDTALQRIIRRYTREGGVRKLAARLVELLEKAGIMIVAQPEAQRANTETKDQIKIGPVEVDHWLEQPYPTQEHVDADGKVGQVNGLYYSIIGGGRMPIQVSHMPGRGKLILTGSLRDVMKEAAQVVVSYIQTHARDLGIDEKTATQLADGKLDIHIHYPDTATPKDGPSAGISTFLALYSSLSGKPVPQNIGLTGEIGLHGEVMPIGGLKEKISGAFAQGVTEFIVPVSNMDQVEDAMRKSKAFANIYSQVRIHYVSTVQDILNVVNQLSNPPKEAPSVAAPQVETPPVPDKTPPEKAAQEPTTPKDPPEPAFSGSRGATQWGIA